MLLVRSLQTALPEAVLLVSFSIPSCRAVRMLPDFLTLGILAAVFPLFGIQMYEKLGFQWATTLLAGLTVLMLPFPYIFFRYGKKIRGTSRFAS